MMYGFRTSSGSCCAALQPCINAEAANHIELAHTESLGGLLAVSCANGIIQFYSCSASIGPAFCKMDLRNIRDSLDGNKGAADGYYNLDGSAASISWCADDRPQLAAALSVHHICVFRYAPGRFSGIAAQVDSTMEVVASISSSHADTRPCQGLAWVADLGRLDHRAPTSGEEADESVDKSLLQQQRRCRALLGIYEKEFQFWFEYEDDASDTTAVQGAPPTVHVGDDIETGVGAQLLERKRLEEETAARNAAAEELDFENDFPDPEPVHVGSLFEVDDNDED